MFFASGVFYYFLTEQVRELVQGMADAFPGGVLVFDAANRTAVKMIAKTWLRTAKIKDVGAYFAVSDAKSELSPWDSRLQVSSRGYMLGYNDLKDPSVSGFFPISRQGWGQRDENADREDRIWRQEMKILVYGAGVLGCNLHSPRRPRGVGGGGLSGGGTPRLSFGRGAAAPPQDVR